MHKLRVLYLKLLRSEVNEDFCFRLRAICKNQTLKLLQQLKDLRLKGIVFILGFTAVLWAWAKRQLKVWCRIDAYVQRWCAATDLL